ncbi:TonB-dependent siderophore receptor [Chroococcidiopsis sp. SAG 2025]|uniref:TonB-dependent siderophore receptor n=1 Tax=Chroococcidiopsis sp. SAG 2025 TaxID=171389 RepID=UPI0029370FC8|nr:TonB-dependent siderophore receptor [Chroococcidiopsis sp. SAG 2025]
MQLQQSDKGLEIILETPDGKSLQVFPTSFGKTFVVNIPNAQLAEGKTFRQENPISGIASIAVTQQGTNSIRVTVTGIRELSKVELGRSDRALTLTLPEAIAPTARKPTPPTTETETAPEPTLQEDKLPPAQGKPEQPPATAKGDEEQEIVVTGEQEGYSVPDASTATRTDTPLRDIPQSIQVVPREVLRDQNITRISEAARNVSSVTVQGGFGNNTDNYVIRGFATYDNLRNGFRDIDSYQSTANIERVEVLKGPTSVLYGQFEPGGVVNYITKKPLSEPYFSGDITIGSYDYYRPSIDISGPLNSDRSLLYRLNVAYENFDSFVDFVNGETFTISPVITAKLGDATTLTLEYEYSRNSRDFYDGLLPEKVTFQLPISRNFSEPESSPYLRDVDRAGLTLEHRFSDRLQLRSAFSAFFSSEDIEYVRSIGQLEPDGRTVPHEYRQNEISQTNYYLQTDLIGKFNTGSISHQMLLGLEYVRDIRTDDCCQGAEFTGLDIFDPVYGSPLPTTLEPGDFTETKSDTVGIYLQDQITLLSNLKLLLGGRVDFFNRNTNVRSGIDGSEEEENLYETPFSPRIGLVYQPIEPISLYASYSRSFVPSDSRTVDGGFLPPTRGTQYEVGIKSEFLDGRLSATLAAYEITKTNVATTDPDNIDFSIAIGEVKSRGIEFDLAQYGSFKATLC